MVRYFYSWAPFVILATVVIVPALPYLGMVAVVVFGLVALFALAALAWAIVVVPYTLSRAIVRRWYGGAGASPQMQPALSRARRQNASS